MAALRNGTRGGGVFKGGIADDIICKCWNEFSYFGYGFQRKTKNASGRFKTVEGQHIGRIFDSV